MTIARPKESPPIRDFVIDAITFHPGNRTGTPDQRRPVSELLADAALTSIRYRLEDLLNSEEFSDDHLGVQRVIELLEER